MPYYMPQTNAKFARDDAAFVNESVGYLKLLNPAIGRPRCSLPAMSGACAMPSPLRTGLFGQDPESRYADPRLASCRHVLLLSGRPRYFRKRALWQADGGGCQRSDGLGARGAMNATFLRFLVTGGIAASVNLASRYALNRFMSFQWAVVVAYLIGMTTAYVLARRFVFDASGRSMRAEFWRFTVVNMFALVFVWCISVGLARGLFPSIGFTWHADDVAHIIGVLAPAVMSYLGHRFYTFARPAT